VIQKVSYSKSIFAKSGSAERLRSWIQGGFTFVTQGGLGNNTTIGKTDGGEIDITGFPLSVGGAKFGRAKCCRNGSKSGIYLPNLWKSDSTGE